MKSDNLVYRSMYLFEDDDAELYMIARRCGVEKPVLIRGIIKLKIKEWTDILHNQNIAPPELLKELEEVIKAGAVFEDK